MCPYVLALPHAPADLVGRNRLRCDLAYTDQRAWDVPNLHSSGERVNGRRRFG